MLSARVAYRAIVTMSPFNNNNSHTKHKKNDEIAAANAVWISQLRTPRCIIVLRLFLKAFQKYENKYILIIRFDYECLALMRATMQVQSYATHTVSSSYILKQNTTRRHTARMIFR